MPLPPGHYREAEARSQEPARERWRAPRHRIVMGLGAALSVALVALVIFSMTSRHKSSGHGCIDFDYTTMIGGAELYKCGTVAREMCASADSPNDSDPGFYRAMQAACREAGLPTPAS